MSRPSEPGRPEPLAAQWGWVLPPRPGAMLVDKHLLLAAAAAVPAWLLLATQFGAAMAAPATLRGWLAFVLLRPLLEELVFRGIVQGELLRWTRGRMAGPLTRANLATTVLFVAAHLLAQPPAWALAVAAPSLVLGHVRDRLRSVWPAVVLHAIYNGGFALAAMWARPGAA